MDPLFLWTGGATHRAVAFGFGVLALWQLYCAASRTRQSVAKIVLRLGGFVWTQDDFWGLAAFYGRVRKRSKQDSTLTEDPPLETDGMPVPPGRATTALPHEPSNPDAHLTPDSVDSAEES